MGTKSGTQEELKAAKKLLEAWRQRLVLLAGYARELPSFVNATMHRDALVRELLKAFQQCEESLGELARVRFPAQVEDDSQRGDKAKTVPTAGLKKALDDERAKVTKLLKQSRTGVHVWEPTEDVELPSGLSVDEVVGVCAMDAAKSARESMIALIFANDSGGDGDFVTAIPEPLAFYLFEICSGRNLASQDQSVSQEADPAAKEFFEFFRLNEHTLRFQLTSGLAKEARNTDKEQAKMADYVAEKNKEIVGACALF